MGKNSPTSLAGISIGVKRPMFQTKGDAAPTTPVVTPALASVAEQGGAPEQVATPVPVVAVSAPPAEAATVTVDSVPAPPAVATPSPAPVPAPEVATSVGEPAKAKAEKPKKAEARPQLPEPTGPLISTTVKLDPKRHMEIKLRTVLTKKSFQEIAVEALDLWLAQQGD